MPLCTVYVEQTIFAFQTFPIFEAQSNACNHCRRGGYGGRPSHQRRLLQWFPCGVYCQWQLRFWQSSEKENTPFLFRLVQNIISKNAVIFVNVSCFRVVFVQIFAKLIHIYIINFVIVLGIERQRDL